MRFLVHVPAWQRGDAGPHAVQDLPYVHAGVVLGQFKQAKLQSMALAQEFVERRVQRDVLLGTPHPAPLGAADAGDLERHQDQRRARRLPALRIAMLQRADHQEERVGAGLVERPLGPAEDLDALRRAAGVRGAHAQDAAPQVGVGRFPLLGDVVGERRRCDAKPRCTRSRERVLHRADAGHVAGRDAHRLLGRLEVEQPVPERQVKEPRKQGVDAGVGSTAGARDGGGHATKDTRRRGASALRHPLPRCPLLSARHRRIHVPRSTLQSLPK